VPTDGRAGEVKTFGEVACGDGTVDTNSLDEAFARRIIGGRFGASIHDILLSPNRWTMRFYKP